MNQPTVPTPYPARHRGPSPGIVATVFTLLFITSILLVSDFAGKPRFPSPLEPQSDAITYFSSRPTTLLICAFLQFGCAVPLGIYTATMVSRLRFLGFTVAGINIAQFGGYMAATFMAASALVQWVLFQPNVTNDATLIIALHYLLFALGGPGYSVPLGLLIAGITIPAAFGKLLPKWVIILGLGLGVIGEFSALSLLIPKALFLIPLTRFPGFIWLIAAGFNLPASRVASATEIIKRSSL